MKILAAVAVFGTLVSVPALAQVGPQVPTGPVCLTPALVPEQPIPRTKVLDPQHILFYTREGRVWENTLKTPCRDLMFHGFVFATHEDEVCSNATAIKVIESGETCVLGPFRPYTPPPAAP